MYKGEHFREGLRRARIECCRVFFDEVVHAHGGLVGKGEDVGGHAVVAAFAVERGHGDEVMEEVGR